MHCTGLVYAEAIWSLKGKLRKLYDYNENTALEIVTHLTYIAAGHVSTWYGGLARFGGCSPGSGYLNYLIADDDDGDLTNGTPHMRAIFEAFNDLEIACNNPVVKDSGCDGTPSEAPVVIAEAGHQEVSLVWNHVKGAAYYEVFRTTEGAKGCDMGKIKVGETFSTSFKDTGLLDGREYYYIVIPKGRSSSCFGQSPSCIAVTPLQVEEKTPSPTKQPSAPPTNRQVSSSISLQATFDSGLGAPSCESVGASCDTGNLLDGRGKIGFNETTEPNYPNTLDGCLDGMKGVYHRHG